MSEAIHTPLDLSGWDNYECGGCGVTISGGMRFRVWDGRLNAPEPGYQYEFMHCPYCGDKSIPLTASVNNE